MAPLIDAAKRLAWFLYVEVIRRLLGRRYYDLRYQGRPKWNERKTPVELGEFLDGRLPGRAIDLGCGIGNQVVYLAQRGWQVLGVDFSPRVLDTARRNVKQSGVRAELLRDDVTALSRVHGAFDLAVDIGCFHTMSPAHKRRYAASLSQILVPGGFWFLYGILHQHGELRGPRGVFERDIDMLQERYTLISRKVVTRKRLVGIFVLQKPLARPINSEP